MLDQEAKDAVQSRTPPPLTPQDVEKRVLRICNEYDKIQESTKKNVGPSFRQRSPAHILLRRLLWQHIL